MERNKDEGWPSRGVSEILLFSTTLARRCVGAMDIGALNWSTYARLDGQRRS